MRWSAGIDRGRGAPPIDAECHVCSEDGLLRRIEVLDSEGSVIAAVDAKELDQLLIRRVEAGEIRAHFARPELDGTRLLSLKDQTERVLFSERMRIAERRWV